MNQLETDLVANAVRPIIKRLDSIDTRLDKIDARFDNFKETTNGRFDRMNERLNKTARHLSEFRSNMMLVALVFGFIIAIVAILLAPLL